MKTKIKLKLKRWTGCSFNRTIPIVGVMFVQAGLAGNAFAADKPEWVKTKPFGEMTCTTTSTRGVEWNPDTQSYRDKSFNSRSFAVQRLDASDPKNTAYFCKPEDRPKDYQDGKAYYSNACYRYDNAPSMLGWSQGWCMEKHGSNGSFDVACETDRQPKIGLRPSGYFYAYGRTQTMNEAKPFVLVAFTDTGNCTSIGRFKTPFMIGSEPAHTGREGQ